MFETVTEAKITTDTLATWAVALIEAGRTTPIDVARIRSDVFPLGLSTRRDGEALFAVERALLDKSPTWADLFCELIVDFVVWGERPTGAVTDEMANWLVRQCNRTGTATTLRCLSAVASETTTMPEWFGKAVGACCGRTIVGASSTLFAGIDEAA